MGIGFLIGVNLALALICLFIAYVKWRDRKYLAEIMKRDKDVVLTTARYQALVACDLKKSHRV